jgi:hypothetical protein
MVSLGYVKRIPWGSSKDHCPIFWCTGWVMPGLCVTLIQLLQKEGYEVQLQTVSHTPPGNPAGFLQKKQP